MNILLLQLKRIGDLIVTTPAIAALRQKFPGAHITLVVSGECAALTPAITGVNRIHVVSRSAGDVSLFLDIARQQFDYCIDFTRNDRSALLTFLSRARKRIVSQRIQVKARLRSRVYNEFVPHRMRDMPTLEYNLALIEPLGISDASHDLHLDLPTASRDQAAALLRESGITGDFIIFHPGSARSEKFWEANRWAEVIGQTLSKWPVTAVLTGGSSPPELAHIGEIKSHSKQPVVDLAGETDLLTLAALIGQATLLVTVDSAPMHFAAATGTPQVVLFGPTNPFHWRPQQSPALILQGESAAPVTEFAPKQARYPMNQISTQSVINAMESLLSLRTARQS